jgi:hypothetical protein
MRSQFNFLINGTRRELKPLSFVFLFLVCTFLIPFASADNLTVSGNSTDPLYTTGTTTTTFEPSIFLGLLVISFAFLIISYIFTNYIFSFFSGLLFLITGAYCMINGFAGVMNTWTYSLSLILIGFGGIITIISGLDLLGSFDSNKRNTEDFEDD